jgi:ketosteroid isomerase-like protein
MSLEQNKAIVRRVFAEIANRGDMSVVDELYANDFVDHSAFPGQAPGPAGIKEAVGDFRSLFPDLEVTIEDLVAEGDKVVSRETWRGTHASSGRAARGEVIHIFHLKDGRIVEEWSKGWDWLNAFEM